MACALISKRGDDEEIGEDSGMEDDEDIQSEEAANEEWNLNQEPRAGQSYRSENLSEGGGNNKQQFEGGEGEDSPH